MIIKQYLRLFYVYNNIRRLALKDMDANTMHKICSHFFFFFIDVLIKMFHCSMWHFLFQSIKVIQAERGWFYVKKEVENIE